MSELTYTRCGDYYIPDLKLSEQPKAPIGKYGRMRRRYLKEHRPGLYSSLILSEKLYPHLLEIDRAAQERMDTMLRHVRLILECNPQKPPEVAIREARKHAAWYMTGMRGAAQFRNRCYHLESYAQAEQLAEDFLRMQEEDEYHEA